MKNRSRIFLLAFVLLLVFVVLQPILSFAVSYNPIVKRFYDMDGYVNAMVLAADGTAYIGGTFTTVDSVSHNYLIKLDPSGNVTSWDPGIDAEVQSLALSPDESTLYAGGIFTTVNGGTTRNHLAAFDTTTAAATAWDPDLDGEVYVMRLTTDGTKLYTGGAFTLVNQATSNTTRNHIAAFNTATASTTSWDPDVDTYVESLALSADESLVYAGGFFTSVNNGGGGITRNYLAAFDATTASTTAWNPDVDNEVYAIVATSSTVYVGGYFNKANQATGNQDRNYLAAFDATTASTTAWNPDVDDQVGYYTSNGQGLFLSGDTIYASGPFTTANGSLGRQGAAQFNLTNGTATGWNPDISPIGGGLDVVGNANFLYVSGWNSSLYRFTVLTPDASLNLNVLNTGVTTSSIALPASPSSISSFGEYKILYGTSTPVSTSMTSFASSSDANLGVANFNGAVSTLVTGLSANTLYYFGLFSFNTSGDPVLKSATDTSTTTLAGVPTGPSVTTNSSSSLTVSWTGSASTSNYIVKDIGANSTSSVNQVVDGLVIYLPFDEGTSTVASDISGNGNNGALTNGPTWASGVGGNAVSLDGSNDFVIVPNAPELEVGDPATFSAWIYMTWNTPAFNPPILTLRDTGGTRYSFHVGGSSDGSTDALGLWDGASYLVASDTAITKNAWHLWTAVVSGGTTTFYVDGVQFGSPIALTPSSASGKPLHIGVSDGVDEHFEGKIDDVRIYNRALTGSEITQLADTSSTAGFKKTYTGLTCSTNYSYQVGAVNSAGVINYTNAVSGTTDSTGCTSTPPTTPTDISVNPDSSTRLSVFWTSSDPTFIVENTTTGEVKYSSSSPVAFTNLSCFSSYSFRVRSGNLSNTYSNFSSPVNGVTHDCGGGSASSGGGGFIGSVPVTPPAPSLNQGGPSSFAPSQTELPAMTTIEAIMARLATLKNQLAQLQVASSAGYGQRLFSRDLRFGDSGEDVRLLQQYLNKLHFFVARQGPGSPGRETPKFGLATRAALVRFQRQYRSELALLGAFRGGEGIFGAATRALLLKFIGQ